MVISSGLLEACSKPEVDIVLRHERVHRHHRDNLRMLAAKLFTITLPRAWHRKLLADLRPLLATSIAPLHHEVESLLSSIETSFLQKPKLA